MINPWICPGYSSEYRWIKSGGLQFTNVNCYICNNFNWYIMAVIKSSALGQARKSIGSTNYYRRAGVQISRNKPVFAPGRTFTPAQLTQQWRMKVVQTILLDRQIGKISNCVNVANNKLYNASSRYNRMVKCMLLNDWHYASDPVADPMVFAEEAFEYIMSTYSIGDVRMAPTRIVYQPGEPNPVIRVHGINSAVTELIRLTNKRRRPSGYLDEYSIGVCGTLVIPGNEGSTLFPILPVLNIKKYLPSDDFLEFDLYQSQRWPSTGPIYVNVVLFIADGANQNLQPLDYVALHCTNNSGEMKVEGYPASNRSEIG